MAYTHPSVQKIQYSVFIFTVSLPLVHAFGFMFVLGDMIKLTIALKKNHFIHLYSIIFSWSIMQFVEKYHL